ncbi:MAG: hypothetical protein ACYCSO_02200 [Cuniculiplasma sp.]
MSDDLEMRDFMLKFYENLVYGMLKSSLTTDDRLAGSYMNLSSVEKRDLDVELGIRSRNIAEKIVDELIAHDLLLDSDPTQSQSKEIDKIVREVLSKYSGE